MMILNKVLKKIGWIPLLTGTGIYGIMLLTESRLILQEYHQIKQLLRQEATTVEWVMNHQITSRRKGLELMVDRQEIRGGMIKNEGELNPQNYIQQKETKNLKIDGREFQVILARSSSLSQNVKSPLSTVILLGRLMIGLSSALTLYFARSSKLKSKQLEEINQKLILQIQKEEATRKILEETTTLQQAILNSANCTIISTTIDGTIRTFNKTAEQLLGYAAADIIEHQTLEFIIKQLLLLMFTMSLYLQRLKFLVVRLS